jgi:hypothetical protein
LDWQKKGRLEIDQLIKISRESKGKDTYENTSILCMCLCVCVCVCVCVCEGERERERERERQKVELKSGFMSSSFNKDHSTHQ